MLLFGVLQWPHVRCEPHFTSPRLPFQSSDVSDVAAAPGHAFRYRVSNAMIQLCAKINCPGALESCQMLFPPQNKSRTAEQWLTEYKLPFLEHDRYDSFLVHHLYSDGSW